VVSRLTNHAHRWRAVFMLPNFMEVLRQRDFAVRSTCPHIIARKVFRYYKTSHLGIEQLLVGKPAIILPARLGWFSLRFGALATFCFFELWFSTISSLTCGAANSPGRLIRVFHARYKESRREARCQRWSQAKFSRSFSFPAKTAFGPWPCVG